MSCWIPESFRKVLEFFESLYQPSVSVGKTKPAVHLVQFAGMAVWVVLFVCVGSWLFGVGIELRLSCWIPDFVRKVLKIFEIFSQPSGPVGKSKPAGSFGSVCWNGSLGGLVCLCWFLVIRSRN